MQEVKVLSIDALKSRREKTTISLVISGIVALFVTGFGIEEYFDYPGWPLSSGVTLLVIVACVIWCVVGSIARDVHLESYLSKRRLNEFQACVEEGLKSDKLAGKVQQFVCAIEKTGRIPINSELKEIRAMLNPESDRKWFGLVGPNRNGISEQQRDTWQSVTSMVKCQSHVEES